ncbi:hypothetical protein B0H11DRAFT_2268329 [Mycena galericulata]|nr:hypothetical protein B0H11DRAFT_2268329 [Mycena galericulata]
MGVGVRRKRTDSHVSTLIHLNHHLSHNAPKLFTPIQVGGLQLRHRVVLAPLMRLRVDPATNVIFPIVETFYAQRASTPGILLISEGGSYFLTHLFPVYESGTVFYIEASENLRGHAGILPAKKMGAYTPPTQSKMFHLLQSISVLPLPRL